MALTKKTVKPRKKIENGKLKIFKIGLTVIFNKPKIIQAIT